MCQGFARATVRTIPTSQADVRPAWLPFVRVANLGDTLAKAPPLTDEQRATLAELLSPVRCAGGVA